MDYGDRLLNLNAKGDVAVCLRKRLKRDEIAESVQVAANVVRVDQARIVNASWRSLTGRTAGDR